VTGFVMLLIRSSDGEERRLSMNLLKVKDLRASFFTQSGEVKAVNGVSFDLEKGKTLGIVGESGSGKSVTAYSIMQILSSAGKIVSGSILFNGKELIGVVLNSEDDQRYKDLIDMWDYCEDKFYDTYVQIEAGEDVTKVRVKRGEVRKVQAVAAEDIAATIAKEEKRSKIDTEIVKKDLKAPVKKGDVVGKVKVYYDGKLINQRNLVAAETVEKGGFLSIFGIPDWLAPFIYITVALLALIIFINYKMKERRRAKARRKREERRRENV
jgi:ABC-type dipeptide/oligopeptide/nickel transport system ATPase component